MLSYKVVVSSDFLVYIEIFCREFADVSHVAILLCSEGCALCLLTDDTESSHGAVNGATSTVSFYLFHLNLVGFHCLKLAMHDVTVTFSLFSSVK